MQVFHESCALGAVACATFVREFGKVDEDMQYEFFHPDLPADMDRLMTSMSDTAAALADFENANPIMAPAAYELLVMQVQITNELEVSLLEKYGCDVPSP